MTRAALLRSAAAALLALSLAVPVLAADADKDGLSDAFEKRYGVTDHQDWDSDGDGVIDSAEDGDKDRLGNLGEQRSGTNPGKWDTDGDGKPDGKEDADKDGRTNAREQDQRPLPAGLKPALRDADDDRQPDRKRCQAGHRVSRVETCTFGDAGSSTTLVVAGDSHATVQLSAYKRIAQARGWKMVTMVKAACPAFLGMHGVLQYKIDKGLSCRKWRRNVIDRLEANPPDYLVYTHANYKLKTISGQSIPKANVPDIWRSSVRRTLKQLPASTKVLVMGRVPRNKTNPVSCLRRHPKDMSRCTTKAIPTASRKIDNAIRAGATQAGGRYATLHDKICSYDPCPVVQGTMLMWRDGGHLTETFAKRLRPSLADVLQRKLVSGGR